MVWKADMLGFYDKRMGIKWCLKTGRGTDSPVKLGDSILSHGSKMTNWREVGMNSYLCRPVMGPPQQSRGFASKIIGR